MSPLSLEMYFLSKILSSNWHDAFIQQKHSFCNRIRLRRFRIQHFERHSGRNQKPQYFVIILQSNETDDFSHINAAIQNNTQVVLFYKIAKSSAALLLF